MYTTLREIACPGCSHRVNEHLWCETCGGSRTVTLVEQQPKARIPRWVAILGGLVAGFAGAYALAVWLWSR